MRKENLYFDSRDAKSKIYAVKWMPETEPKAVIQLVHGMAEYIERYDAFAEYLTECGFLVVGDDHLGHGKTASYNQAQLGYFCAKHADTVLVRDEHRLKKTIQAEYPGIPYFILGHSMGSFIVRNYICRYGSGINGAVIMGTGMQPKGLLAVSKILAGIQKVILGADHVAELLNSLAFGTYNKRIGKGETEMAWLTKDTAVQGKYINDPFCGFTFTVNGFETLFNLIWNLHDKNYLNKMPKSLPIFFVSGEEDPVGEYGKAVKSVYSSFKEIGMEDVSIKLYPKDRHEIVNETDKEQVYEDIRHWIEAHL